MTIRVPVANPEVSWHDQQQVNQEDVSLDQTHHDNLRASIINNHFGSGVLLNSLESNIIFDSSILDATQLSLLSSGLFDGSPIFPTSQPTDVNLGNQIAVILSDSEVFGRQSVKVVIIGLSFDGNLQLDKFYFHKNETQITSKHYTKILCIFFNDFLGNSHCSKILGGKIVIRETLSLEFSRDPIMISQEVSPDLFWRDFKRADLSLTLLQTIQSGLGSEYDANALNIDTEGLNSKELVFEDVTSQIGQKIIAKTNNLQKITLLLGATEDLSVINEEDKFNWTGDLVISVYALQTAKGSCPSTIIPDLAIEFDPAAIPLEQLSYNQVSLKDLGYVLTDILQPIDFVFNSTSLGKVNNSLTVDNYYAITIKRSGANTSGNILIGCGNNTTENSRLTLFGGDSWVDIPSESLWFQIWTDAVKIADGQMYDAGNGCFYPKTKKDSITGAEIDNQEKFYNFSATGENTVNIGVVQAVLNEVDFENHERTGNPVISKKQFLPALSLVTQSKFAELQQTSEPVSVGCIVDTNPKLNPILNKTQEFIGLAKDNIFCIINPDPDLLSLNLLGSKLIPDSECCSQEYLISKSILCQDGYGDLNGDGLIDQTDVLKLGELLGESLYYESTQQKILDGYISTLELLKADLDGDGYITSDDLDLLTQYVNKVTNSFPVGSSFNHLCLYLEPAIGRYDGYFDCDDGYVRLDGYIESNLVDIDDLDNSDLLFDGYQSFPDLLADNPALSVIPFVSVPYQIKPQPFWQDYLLLADSDARLVPCTFTYPDKLNIVDCTENSELCLDKNDIKPECDPGRNDFFVPDNLYVGGKLLTPTGDFYKNDLEIVPIVLILPELPLTEVSINIFEKLVAELANGKTAAAFNALKYSDCSFVQLEDLSLNKIRFECSIQSISWNLDGYVSDGYDEGFGIVVNPGIGLYMDQSTGILTINAADLNLDPIYKTLSTKIQIIVYLKQAGWNNQPITILSDQISGLISS